MRQGFTTAYRALLLLGMAAGAAPLAANVRDGVEAWSRGDYAAAVAAWQAPAEAGDADALFNLGQAYRLGRGVPQDMARAEALYARAAAGGHLQAADTYGLMLFQDGRRQEALPYVEGAARRGDPRAQYLLGIAHFNGDLVPLDWERAYALLTLANAVGLPQAAPAIAQMDEHIPLDQRQRGAALALRLNEEAEAARAVELASADLGAGEGAAIAAPAPAATVAAATPRVPRAIPTTAVSPSVAAARAAVAEAVQATGTENPADAGASYARPVATARTTPAAVPTPAPARPAQVAAAPAPVTAASGPWRVQLGAFSVEANATRLWDRLSARPELAGRERLLLRSGNVTRLLAGGYPTRAAADAACRALRAAGQECVVSRS